MHTKNASFNDGSNGEIVKDLSKVVPHVMISVFFTYFVVKSIDKGYCSWLMISSEKDNFIRIFKFIEKQEGDSFNRMVSPIYKIANHDVTLVRQITTLLKHL